jgi:hypothetical protein
MVYITLLWVDEVCVTLLGGNYCKRYLPYLKCLVARLAGTFFVCSPAFERGANLDTISGIAVCAIT